METERNAGGSGDPGDTGSVGSFADALRGQYRLEGEIGRGGMGVVYRATDLKLDRQVAIKTLPPSLASDPVVRARFVREGRTAARLEHPGIVTIHRADELAGHAFFVMQYVPGPSLAGRIAEAPGGLDPRAVTFLLMDVASALHYAHEQAVVHRDVKPENILVGANRQAIVTDFGIATLAAAQPLTPALTATGQVLGTAQYLSPEQIRAEGPVDGRSDICSLGVVGYLALSGRYPFDGPTGPAVIAARMTQRVPSLRAVAPHVPAELAMVIERCLASDPGARYQDGDELKWALASVLGVGSSAFVVPRVDGAGPGAGVGPGSGAGAGVVAPGAGAAGASGAAGNGKPPLVSDSEKHRIMGRAAELDAITGGRPRPPIVAAVRDAAADRARSSGHQLENVLNAAMEAGIARESVEQTFAEHGLRPGARVSAAVVESGKGTAETAMAWLRGGPSAVTYELLVEGELDGRDHEAIVHLLRRETGLAGELDTLGRELTWQATSWSHGELVAKIEPAGGRTSIQIVQRIVGGLRVRALVVAGVTVIAIVLGGVAVAHGANASVMRGVVVGAAALAWWGTRRVYGRGSRMRGEHVRALAERVAGVMLGAETRA